MGRLIDLSNKRFGKLLVIRRVEDNILPSGLKEPMWLCDCDCGNITIVRGAFLRTGHTISCGCAKDTFNDLSGLRFNDVLVLKPVKSKDPKKYLCLCDCGNHFITRGSSLKNNHTKSCGCRKKNAHYISSKGERWISEFLSDQGYCFEAQKSFPDLYGVNGGLLFFDFCLKIKNKLFLIECQGNHHYEPVDHFGGVEKFKICKKHDEIKRSYVMKHPNLILIELKYPSHYKKEKFLKDLTIALKEHSIFLK